MSDSFLPGLGRSEKLNKETLKFNYFFVNYLNNLYHFLSASCASSFLYSVSLEVQSYYFHTKSKHEE